LTGEHTARDDGPRPGGGALVTAADVGQAALGLKRGEVDVVVGGPPCQGFSKANSNRSRWWPDRAQPNQDTLQAALGLLQAGEELFGVYPEGRRSSDGRLYRGRTGVGWLALASGVPVIPVAMIGTDRVLAPGHTIPGLHKVGIPVGEPMTFGAYRDWARPPGLAGRSPTTS